MTLHRLKTWPEFYTQLQLGKTAELRQNDRNFACGDVLDLCEFDREARSFTGRHEVREVIMVTELDALGDAFRGYVLLSLREGV